MFLIPSLLKVGAQLHSDWKKLISGKISGNKKSFIFESIFPRSVFVLGLTGLTKKVLI